MLKKTVTYIDFNEKERTEDFYFNLTQAEITEMELSVDGGLAESIQKVINSQSNPEIIKIFKGLVLKAYGEKSADGRRFKKDEETTRAFSETQAYSNIFMELAMNSKEAAEFVNGIIPSASKTASDKPVAVN